MTPSRMRADAKNQIFALKWQLGGYMRDYRNHLMNYDSAIEAVKRMRLVNTDTDSIKSADAFISSIAETLKLERQRIKDTRKELGRLNSIVHSQKRPKNIKGKKRY